MPSQNRLLPSAAFRLEFMRKQLVKDARCTLSGHGCIPRNSCIENYDSKPNSIVKGSTAVHGLVPKQHAAGSQRPPAFIFLARPQCDGVVA
eukprot:COSAG02_NODE_2297_length_9196_cov_9.809608_2_plen_91_part_00